MSSGERSVLLFKYFHLGGKKKEKTKQRMGIGDWHAVRSFYFLNMFSLSSVNYFDSRACQ